MTRSLSHLEPGSAEDRPSCPRVFACGPLVIGEVLGTFGRGAERTDLHLTGIVRLTFVWRTLTRSSPVPLLVDQPQFLPLQQK